MKKLFLFSRVLPLESFFTQQFLIPQLTKKKEGIWCWQAKYENKFSNDELLLTKITRWTRKKTEDEISLIFKCWVRKLILKNDDILTLYKIVQVVGRWKNFSQPEIVR